MHKIYLLAYAENLPPKQEPNFEPPTANSPVAILSAPLVELYENVRRFSTLAGRTSGRLSVLRVLWESYLLNFRPVATLCWDSGLGVRGTARNMPEICVWQLAFDIQSCRALLTKRTTYQHTHPDTHTHTQPDKRTHTTIGRHSTGLQFISNNGLSFLNVAFFALAIFFLFFFIYCLRCLLLFNRKRNIFFFNFISFKIQTEMMPWFFTDQQLVPYQTDWGKKFPRKWKVFTKYI